MIKVKVKSSSPTVAIPGLGIVKTNDWVEVTPEQAAAFELHNGVTLEKSSLETKKTTTKKEAS